jgi:hypothetical protein
MKIKNMKIKNMSEADVESLLDAIAQDITDAHANYRLFCDISDSITEFDTEMAQSKTFWGLTTTALKESALLHLCRVYDQTPGALSLAYLLNTFKANPDWFSEDKFRIRLSANPYVDSLAESNWIPSAEEIEADIKLATNEHKAVEKLTLWRSNVIAHRNAKFSMGKNQVLVDKPLSEKDVEFLLKNALSIYNRYSDSFRASTNISTMFGQDDYKSVLEYIRVGLAQRIAELESH